MSADDPAHSPKQLSAVEMIWRRLAYAIDRNLKTGRRRSEFEHKYRDHGDYFNYHSSPIEMKKYDDTLAVVRDWAMTGGSALEIGCSVGAFTSRIAPEFEHLTSVDIAQEAIALASKAVGEAKNVSFVRSDLVALDLNRTFDKIFCGEILMYLREERAPEVCSVLDRHLAPGGYIIEVSQQDRVSGFPKFFHGWDRILGEYFRIDRHQRFDDPKRPWEVVAYVRR